MKIHGNTLKLIAHRELVRRRLVEFAKDFVPNYVPQWVHHDICERLQRFSDDVAAKKSPRLMLLVPPRHGKSALASICFPAWHLGRYPTQEIINVGYSLDLPMKFSRQVRDIVREKTYQAIYPEMRLNAESQSVEEWMTTKGGGYKAAGVGGGITGRGCHILIIDDPIRNQEDADSIDLREKLDEWYQSTASTRLAPGGGVLFIETWWHDDDLAGRFQQRMKLDVLADQYEIVKYPALAEKFEYRHRGSRHIERSDRIQQNDPDWELLRRPGESLDPDRYPVVELERKRANMSTRIWSALYQQNPVPEEGAYFRKEYIRLMPRQEFPRGTRYYCSWDFAIGEKKQNDWTVGAVIAHLPNDTLWLADMRRFKGDAHVIMTEIIDLALAWMNKPDSSFVIGFEDGQIWRSIEPTLRVAMRSRGVYPPYEVLKPLTDKLARANPLQARMQHGRFFMIEDLEGINDVVHEFLRFPAGAHDDIVDAVAWATRMAVNKPSQVDAVKNKPLKSWKDKLAALGRLGGGTHMGA